MAAGCATVAEVRKRGDDFWGEFEFYLSDLVVGCVLDCVLVGLLAPSAVIGAKPKTKPSGKPNACLHDWLLPTAVVWCCDSLSHSCTCACIALDVYSQASHMATNAAAW